MGRTIQRIADETGVAIMTTPVDTYAAGKLISQCAPISYYMTRDNILKFTLVDPRGRCAAGDGKGAPPLFPHP